MPVLIFSCLIFISGNSEPIPPAKSFLAVSAASLMAAFGP